MLTSRPGRCLSPAAVVAAALLTSALPAWADSVLSLRTERAVVFKDGHALLVKSVTGKLDGSGTGFIENVPDSAVLGTFWALSADGKTVGLRAEYAERETTLEQKSSCLSMADLLRANAGKSLTLTLASSGRLDAKIVEVLEGTQPPINAGDDLRAVLSSVVVPPAPGGQYVVLELDGVRRVIPVGEVQHISGASLETTITRSATVKSRVKRLTIDLGRDAAEKEVSLRMMYFSPGLSWIPTYRVEGVDTPEATLWLQGEVVNDLEDLSGAKLDLVAGVPNFRFGDSVSPLSLESALRETMGRRDQAFLGQQLSNAAFRDARGTVRAEANEPGAPPVPGELIAAGEQDLHVYSLGEMTLKKGARASVPVWNAKAAVRHVYTLDLKLGKIGRAEPQYSNPADRPGGPAGDSPLGLLKNRVWHQVELTNAGASPWTTGPALVMNGVMPISQDLLTYTSKGAKCRLPLTVSADIAGTYKETELERQPNALNWNGYQFAKVSKKGVVTLVNRRTEASRVCVSVSMGGRAKAATAEGEIIVDAGRGEDFEDSYNTNVNNHSDVQWELELKPGETRTLEVEYDVFLR
ncbi:MAG: hypothetical protein JNL50_01265 [Phycisphaerae bacterium]|nr:hypothetical protein [Phycisphaerae bacterium]